MFHEFMPGFSAARYLMASLFTFKNGQMSHGFILEWLFTLEQKKILEDAKGLAHPSNTLSGKMSFP